MEQPASMRHDDEGPMNDSDALLPGHIQRANIWRLAIAQALAGANAVAVYAAGAIIGSQLAPSPMLATLPISVFVVGMAVCILPAGAIARRHGRRAAFLAGTAAGVVAGLLAMLAVIVGGFWLFCLATFFGGAYAAVVLSFRFAATDGVAPAQRARALSLVMAGGVAAGVVGPQLVTWTMDLWPRHVFAATFLVQALVAALGRIGVGLQEVPVGIDLDGQQEGHLEDRALLAEILADALLLGERIRRHGCTTFGSAGRASADRGEHEAVSR